MEDVSMAPNTSAAAADDISSSSVCSIFLNIAQQFHGRLNARLRDRQEFFLSLTVAVQSRRDAAGFDQVWRCGQAGLRRAGGNITASDNIMLRGYFAAAA